MLRFRPGFQRAVAAKVKPSLEEVASQIAEDARKAAPRGKTDTLADSITYEVGEDGEGAFARISWGRKAFYGGFIELGTSRAPARPFLRPAAEKKRGKL